MSVVQLSLAAGQTVSPAARLAASFPMFQGNGISCLLNFSGQGVGYGTITPAQGNVTLQVSNDPNANPNQPLSNQALARWNNHDTIVGQTTDKNSSIIYPCAYVRLVGTVVSGVVDCFVGVPDSGNLMAI
jgi:hypothetical protein